MHRFVILFLVFLALQVPWGSRAAAALFLQEVATGCYAIVGEMGNRSPENLGNNATFGFVVTPEGVVLIDSGASWRGAEQIASVIGRVTDHPVRIVINTGGQDHRWLGNGYFKSRGARIIAHEAAVKDQQTRVALQLAMLQGLAGREGMQGTEPVYADETFSDSLQLELGGRKMVVQHGGWAHTPGDSFVWLPKERIAYSGDIVYLERMLGVMEHSRSRSWLQAFDAISALSPRLIIPGHGHPAGMERAEADTRRYLAFLRKAVADYISSGGDAIGAGSIDQSAFSYLVNFDTLAGRNALQVFSEIEWE